MKKVIKPAEREEAVYYSDFKGHQFDGCGPHVQIKIDFNYGSVYDGAQLTFDLTDDEFKLILEILKKNSSTDYKNFIQKRLTKEEQNLDESTQFRDWDCCSRLCDSISLYEEFLNIKEEK